MEKRSNTRVFFNVNSTVKFDNKTITGDVINLSLHGMLLSSPELIPVDTEVTAEIEMGGTTSDLKINVEGKVIRSDENGSAIAFQSIDIDSFVHLKNIVAYNEGDEEKIMKEFLDSCKRRRAT